MLVHGFNLGWWLTGKPVALSREFLFSPKLQQVEAIIALCYDKKPMGPFPPR